MVKIVSEAITIFRTAIGRRNENDPDSSDNLLLNYLNDFVSLTMPNDTKLFESFGTLSFIIDSSHADGVYTFNDLGADSEFINISSEAFISLLDPINNSVSWNQLHIYQDPGQFFGIWGINNVEILQTGFPTMMLFYGNEFTFRTIPQEDVSYLVKIYGYKKNYAFNSSSAQLPFDYWLRYIAYGAAINYSRDYRYSANDRQMIQDSFNKEKTLLLTRTHNQIVPQRAYPRF